MEKFTYTSRRKFLTIVSTITLGTILPYSILSKNTHSNTETPSENERISASYNWQVGVSRKKITPKTKVWLAGYDYKRVPYGKIHDLYVKVLALKDTDDKIVVLATTDNQGMSKTVYESIYRKIHQYFGIERKDFMLTFSHNHSGPRLTDDLKDYYPVEEEQERLVAEYSDWMGEQVIEAVREALENWQPAQLFKGEGECTFAVNRRENKESEVVEMLKSGKELKGPVDHSVPVLAIKGESGNLICALFGYACHATTISFNAWSGDYPGFAQINLEKNNPGMAALFFNGCGADQNPLPRRELELCEKYGKMLSDAVEKVLTGPMESISSGIKTAFDYVPLEYEEIVTKEKLLPIAEGNSRLHARWAKRMLEKIDSGTELEKSYLYPVQAWKLGNELLLIGIGGEAVVDYSLRFKKEYDRHTTWVCGYANEMAAYIPSRRVWEEGGYEGGSHLDEYGRPAWRWAGDVEERIGKAVRRLVFELE